MAKLKYKDGEVWKDIAPSAEEFDRHLADYASMEFGERPYNSKTNITYYLDEASGSDSNNGTSAGTAFATMEKVMSVTPINIRHFIEVRLIGNYSGEIKIENIKVYGAQGGFFTFIGDTGTPSNHEVQGAVIFENCFCAENASVSSNFRIRGFRANEQITVVGSVGISLDNIEPRKATTNSGISVAYSKIEVLDCDFGSGVVRDCILANYASDVISENNTGSGTRRGLSAMRNSTVGKNNTQPTGAETNEYTFSGGVIR